MSERDNDSLERFFQKAAKAPEVEYHEGDWSKLEARLDAEALKHVPDQPNHWKLGVTSAVILLFLTGITYFFLNESNPNKLTSPPTKDAVSRKENTEMSSPGHKTENTKAFAQANLTPTAKKNNSLAETQPVNTAEPGGAPILVDEAKQLGVVESKVTESEPAGSNGYLQVRSSPSVEDSTHRPAIEDEPIVAKTEIAVTGESWPSREETDPTTRWSMVFSFAPDFSSAGSSQYTSPGVAFGLVAHYHFNGRFSVSTGLVRSHKKYWSNGSDYHPPKGYWGRNTNGIVPETIDGTCNVLEIPLSLQYKVAKMKRSRMFVTAGFSSYLMLDESYRFSFENPNPGSNEGWDSSGPSRFLFSIANVSAAYEHDILPNVAIGIEPYAKIPVTAIGWSGLKLFSMGAAFTVRYSIPKKK